MASFWQKMGEEISQGIEGRPQHRSLENSESMGLWIPYKEQKISNYLSLDAFPLTEKSLDPYSTLAQKGVFVPQSIQSPHKSIG
jgi:hypothetical protein